MTTTVKKAMTLETPTKNYLQAYMDYLEGYKEYKLEKLAPQWHVPVGSKLKKIQG